MVNLTFVFLKLALNLFLSTYLLILNVLFPSMSLFFMCSTTSVAGWLKLVRWGCLYKMDDLHITLPSSFSTTISTSQSFEVVFSLWHPRQGHISRSTIRDGVRSDVSGHIFSPTLPLFMGSKLGKQFPLLFLVTTSTWWTMLSLATKLKDIDQTSDWRLTILLKRIMVPWLTC